MRPAYYILRFSVPRGESISIEYTRVIQVAWTKRILVVTHSASPYQVEFFNALAQLPSIELGVVYLFRSDPTRQWSVPVFSHSTLFLDGNPDLFYQACELVKKSDLVIFNYYANKAALRLLRLRSGSGHAWCFWGERPGFRKPAWVGCLRRWLSLFDLHKSNAAIWGIGRYAVDGYRGEFGMQRLYFDLPYFSDLSRFHAIDRSATQQTTNRTFLFSGSLIHRKGVDILARAFVRLARIRSNVRLKILGAGEMRETLDQLLQPVIGQVEFLGFQDWDDLPNHYVGADVLCVPSRYDGWGLVVPEGLAAGLPVIGTTTTGAALEFLKTGHNGWLIPAKDEYELFMAMDQAASLSADELKLLSKNARRSIREHSLEHGVDRFVQAAHESVESWSLTI